MTRINKTSKLICEILPPYHPPTLMRGVQRVLNNITNYTGCGYICTCMHMYLPCRKLGGSASARERYRCSVMNLYEALKGLRCPEARLCRCLNRNSGLLRSYTRYGDDARTERQRSWTNMRKGEKEDQCADSGRCRRDMKGSQVVGPNEDDSEL